MKTRNLHFLVFAFLFFGFTACESTRDQPTPSRFTIADVEIERLEEVEILYSDSAQVRVRITAPTMLRHLERGNARQEFPDGIRVDFFDNYLRPSGSLIAKYGNRYESSQKVVVRDSVIWQSKDGDQLETEELTWDEREQKVFTNQFVTIIREKEIIYGHGFEAEQDFSQAHIKAVEGRIKVDTQLAD